MANTAAMKEAITGKPATPTTNEKPQTEYERFRNYVQTVNFLNDVAVLVGGEQQARTFVRCVLTAVQKTPRLLEVDRRSLLLACMAAARDRLMPDGKEAVLNIYNTEQKDPKTGRKYYADLAQYLPMAAGLIKKMYESGHVSFVDAAAVYQGDEFIYERGDSPKLVHRPTLADEPGPIVAAYVVVKLTNGEIKREVMPRRDVEKVRAASKAADAWGWKTWYDQFAIKSVIKRAYKQLPSSVELERVIRSDNEAMGFREPTTMGGEFEAFTTETPTPPTEPPKAEPPPAAPAPPALEHAPGETIPSFVFTGETIPAAAVAEGLARAGMAEQGSAAAPGEAPSSGQPAAPEASTAAAAAAPAAKPAKQKPTPPAAPTIATVMRKIHEAKTREEWNEAADLARSLENDVERRQATNAANERLRELEAGT